MQYLIYILFIAIFSAEFLLSKLGLTLKAFALLPEMISFVCGLFVLLFFAFNKNMRIPLRYLFFYLALTIHITIGLVGNFVQPLTIFAGLRIYLKFLPFYFLPIAYHQTDCQIGRQLKFLLVIAVVQLPLSVYQRLIEFQFASGDYIAGTLGTAPMMTLFLVSTISVLIGFYLKGKLSFRLFIALILIAFLPTSINETKATFILLPVAALVPMIFGLSKDKRVKVIFTLIPAFVLLIFGYLFLYQTFYGGRADVISFYTSDKLSNYMYKDSDAATIEGNEGDAGRIDSIILAYEANSDNLFKLVWGVGIGNAAKSFSKKFEGEYSSEYLRLGGKMTGLSHFIWEIGILGLVYVLWFLCLVFIDALKLSKQEGFTGSFALGWMGVILIAVLTLPYQNIISKDALVYTFLYFTGIITSIRIQNDIQDNLSITTN